LTIISSLYISDKQFQIPNFPPTTKMKNPAITVLEGVAEAFSILWWNTDPDPNSLSWPIILLPMFFVAAAFILILLFVMRIMHMLLGVFIICILILTKDNDEFRPDVQVFPVYTNTKLGCGCCDPHFFNRRRERIEMKDMQAWHEELMEFRIEKEYERRGWWIS
jgi:hypothetical protein